VNCMTEDETLEKQIKEIKQRNQRVEADKAWETSVARRTILAVGTYLFSVFLLLSIEAPNPYLSALVPAGAYLLSTLTLPIFKKSWLNSRK